MAAGADGVEGGRSEGGAEEPGGYVGAGGGEEGGDRLHDDGEGGDGEPEAAERAVFFPGEAAGGESEGCGCHGMDRIDLPRDHGGRMANFGYSD